MQNFAGCVSIWSMGRIPPGFKKPEGGYRKTISKDELVAKKAEYIKKYQEEKQAEGAKKQGNSLLTTPPFKVDISKDAAAAKAAAPTPAGASAEGGSLGVKIIPKPPTETETAIETGTAAVNSEPPTEKARALLNSNYLPPDQKKVLNEILNKEAKK